MSLTEHVLYGGEVVITFDEEPHKYVRIKPGPETVLAGATTKTGILDKPFLRKWYLEQGIKSFKELLPIGGFLTESLQKEIEVGIMGSAEKARNKAGDIGREVHEHVSYYIKSKIGFHDPLPPSDIYLVNKCFTAWRDWEAGLDNIQWLDSERIVYSMHEETTGMLDQVGNLRGTKTLFDVKCSGNIYDEYYLQMGGYYGMYNEEMRYLNQPEVEQAQIVRIDKEKGVVKPGPMVSKSDLDDLYQKFLMCHRLYVWQKLWPKRLKVIKNGDAE